MEKEPNYFQCQFGGGQSWEPCTKDEICLALAEDPSFKYRAVETDSEYMENWVQRFDMLCEPSHKVGLLGSMYFVGILIGLLFVPKIADVVGRRLPFIITLSASAIG